MDYEDEKFDPAHRWEVIATDDVQEDLDAFSLANARLFYYNEGTRRE